MREVFVFFFEFWKYQILREEEKGNPKVLSFVEVEDREKERERERVTVMLD